MKALNCKPVIFLVTLLFLGSGLYAKEVKKNFQKEFKTNQSSSINLDLKFTDLQVTTWNQDQAVFDVTLVAEHEDEASANKILDMLRVEFNQSGNEIVVITRFDDKLSKGEWGKSKKFKVIIDAKIPAGIHFILDNSLGSASISELSGEVSIDNNFGSLVIDRLTGNEIELELNYGEVRISKLANAQVELNYGSLEVKDAGDLELESNFASCKLGAVNNLSAEVNMGDLEVDLVRKGFKLVEIENSKASVVLGIDKEAGFKLDASMVMGDLECPPLNDQVKSKKNMGQKITGSHGNGNAAISLKGSMGSIEVQLK